MAVTIFADSSAIVKLYVPEPGHEQVRALGDLVVSSLARVEVAAALWRRQRTGHLSPQGAQALCLEFAADWTGTNDEDRSFDAIVPTDGVIHHASELCAIHGLRAFDAVQLASACAARAAEPACSRFATFDRDLQRAAGREGFTVAPA